jgi:RNA polymerase sigma-70 factor, ECF subfamily
MALPQPSPKALDAARRGDQDALAALLDEWLPVVLAWCKRLGGPRVDPHDAAQDVLIVVMDRLEKVWSADRFRPWLFGVTRRVLARHRRAAWVKRWVGDLFADPADEARGPERLAEMSETSRKVHRALDALSVDHREVIVLCDLEHRTDEEVAELLAVPVGTVKSRLRRARAAFRTAAIRQGLGPLVQQIAEAS